MVCNAVLDFNPPLGIAEAFVIILIIDEVILAALNSPVHGQQRTTCLSSPAPTKPKNDSMMHFHGLIHLPARAGVHVRRTPRLRPARPPRWRQRTACPVLRRYSKGHEVVLDTVTVEAGRHLRRHRSEHLLQLGNVSQVLARQPLPVITAKPHTVADGEARAVDRGRIVSGHRRCLRRHRRCRRHPAGCLIVVESWGRAPDYDRLYNFKCRNLNVHRAAVLMTNSVLAADGVLYY